jgi:hypothetical protein
MQLILLLVSATLFFIVAFMTTLVHERGHALVALRHAGDVAVEVGLPPRCLARPAIAACLGLKRVDLWVGCVPIGAGRCLHSEIRGQAALVELYEAGFKATESQMLRRVAICVGVAILALTALTAVLSSVGPSTVFSGFLGLLSAVYPALHTKQNRSGRRMRRDTASGFRRRTQHGSDAWNLEQIRADPMYVPQQVPTASELRRCRQRPPS